MKKVLPLALRRGGAVIVRIGDYHRAFAVGDEDQPTGRLTERANGKAGPTFWRACLTGFRPLTMFGKGLPPGCNIVELIVPSTQVGKFVDRQHGLLSVG